MIIKDSKGKEIEKWVSTDTPKYIENLKPGKYTLTELIATEGYILSEEVIEFEVNKDYKIVNEVIMYNTRAIEVPITASNKSIFVYFVGIIGMLYGIRAVYKNARI